MRSAKCFFFLPSTGSGATTHLDTSRGSAAHRGRRACGVTAESSTPTRGPWRRSRPTRSTPAARGPPSGSTGSDRTRIGVWPRTWFLSRGVGLARFGSLRWGRGVRIFGGTVPGFLGHLPGEKVLLVVVSSLIVEMEARCRPPSRLNHICGLLSIWHGPRDHGNYRCPSRQDSFHLISDTSEKMSVRSIRKGPGARPRVGYRKTETDHGITSLVHRV